MFGKIPWVSEAEIWKTLPKTSRVPTGGWRGYYGLGAVPSHSYPQPATLPGGYWRGMGMVPSVYDPACQAAKTMSGFGVTATPATPTPAATPAPATTSTDWSKTLETILKAGTQAYTTYATTKAQEEAVKAGVPITAFYPPAQAAPGATPTPTPGSNKTLLYVGVAAGLGLLAFMAFKR